MRKFIITEAELGAVANCIGSAIHQCSYGQVATLVAMLENLPQVSEAAQPPEEANSPQGKASQAGVKLGTDGEPAAPQAKNV